MLSGKTTSQFNPIDTIKLKGTTKLPSARITLGLYEDRDQSRQQLW